MTLRTTITTALLWAGLLAATPAVPGTLIEQAYQAGELDLHAALLYQIQAIRDPQQLPAQYRELPQHPVCGTPLLVEAMAAAQSASGDYPGRLAKVMARPSRAHDLLTPSGHFRIHYDISGTTGVDPADADGSGVPDFVEEVARTLDQVRLLQVQTMGFNAPPEDGSLGGGPEYDVYISELGRGGAYGFTYPEVSGKTTFSYLELDNNYTDAIYRQTNGADALHVTVAHEFNHGIQFGYYQGNDGIWWQEATATWMEEIAYPDVDDYLQYLSSFLLQPEKSLDSGSRFATDFHIYGASIFAHFLHQRYDADLMRAIWQALGDRGTADISQFDRVIRSYDAGGLASAMAEFSVWNYFTGHRHRSGYYHEGDKYPAVRTRDIAIDVTAPRTPVEREASVDHLSATYLRLEPGISSGGVSLDVDFVSGRWRKHLILAGSDSVQVLTVGEDMQYVTGWDQYNEVVLVLTEIDPVGAAFGYQARITYDPDLLDVPLPTAMRLGPVYPNPFRSRIHQQLWLPYALDESSPVTRLSILDGAGRLVRRFDLGQRGQRRDTQAWDGTNDAGEPVGSGVYYAVLDAAGGQVRSQLAVIREGQD
jgi:hypothetical protein